ncbi:c-type cytochrome [Mucilaginibacter sp. RCC_168]|uniref:c-type cytochrome n=1 Tax=Mucilaginibacter sp. RCC_168 TaxID=3239221 RepID=UPI0035248B04
MACAVLFYKKGCLCCHKIDTTGGLTGPDLSKADLRLSDEQIKVRIVNGGDNIPAYGGMLTGQQLHSILTFLKTRR